MDFEFALQYLGKQNAKENDLVVVHNRIKERMQKATKATVCGTNELDSLDLSKHNRLLWLTERSDPKAKTVDYFLRNKKEFQTISGIGPARVWHHDPLKEKVLQEEYDRQKEERIEKFSYGTGADFGNILQFIDQAKHLEGDFVEVGCFLGSSTCVIVNYLEQIGCDKTFFVYNVFDGFDYDEALKSSDASWAGTHKTDGLAQVRNRLLKRTTRPELLEVVRRNICDEEPQFGQFGDNHKVELGRKRSKTDGVKLAEWLPVCGCT